MSSTPDITPTVINLQDVKMDRMTFRLGPGQEPMVFEGKLLWCSEDRKHAVGIERITPEEAAKAPPNPGVSFSQFDYFLEGKVTIEVPGQDTREAGTGVIALLPAGLKSTWTTQETMVKVFTMFSDTPIEMDHFFGEG